MDLSNILAINGKPGLFKLISKGKTNFIVESILDGKKMPAFSHDGVSSLDNIAIFTEEEDIALEKVFEAIYKYENGKQIAEFNNDSASMKKYFETILPNYDKERVYVSNIKKILAWYNLLAKNDLLDFTEEAKGTGKTNETNESGETVENG
ncbi:DUF5606 domain-containing protein [Bacteroidales bacterium OttesenSCG-928-B11]|nr:DUF5606 domain-containing protein [Bacteroidales bacterium OttesenSCG-928-C03]MDL2312468.1 DUF5606 domain-containing protein [Bacteroidales bacterium OttesenSCG-928-B11]MDL2326533.1 DUF5606 domain-containing protein [Bacteroidales bacterium OttesenSCG-928-A14]